MQLASKTVVVGCQINSVEDYKQTSFDNMQKSKEKKKGRIITSKERKTNRFSACRFLFLVYQSIPCNQWFLKAGRYATKGEKPLRATVCFSIEHARPRDDYEYPTTRRQRELQQNNRFNKQNNNFARASRFYFCISLPFLHDYDVKMPNFAFYG